MSVTIKKTADNVTFRAHWEPGRFMASLYEHHFQRYCIICIDRGLNTEWNGSN